MSRRKAESFVAKVDLIWGVPTENSMKGKTLFMQGNSDRISRIWLVILKNSTRKYYFKANNQIGGRGEFLQIIDLQDASTVNLTQSLDFKKSECFNGKLCNTSNENSISF
ncbi:MAG: hypothetical protein CL605_07025 [Altibacter sp.]|nr:hypothetical protein [Altibacter sp.]